MEQEITERLTALETKISHLEHLTDRLNEVIIEQGRELHHLKKKLENQAESLQTIELERIRSTNSKPPHYQ